MVRISWALLAALLAALPSTARAENKSLGGNWKVTVLLEGQRSTLWIVKLEAKDSKWTGAVLANQERAPAATLSNVSVAPDQVHFTLKGKTQTFSFEGKLPPTPAGEILGSVVLGPQIFPGELQPTQLATLDDYDLSKEIVETGKGGPEVIEAASTLLGQAEDKKAPAQEVSIWADKAVKNAEPYGRRYQREIALRIADLLNDQEGAGYADVAVTHARLAESLLKPDDKASARKRVLTSLATALTRAGQTDEAKKVEARNDKIAWPTFEPYAGRKGASDRVVLLELFTGSECPPCVAADLAFDALGKAYKPSEVALLEYHLHVPGPDPLTNQDTEARQKYYGEAVPGTPAIFFDGKPDDSGGGFYDAAQEKYQEYSHLLNPQLDQPAGAKLKVTAVRRGKKVEITAEAADVAVPGPDTRLRLALVEDQVQYRGGNKIPSYHHVVRAMPGGPMGLSLKEKTGRESVTVDLKDLRIGLSTYLADAAKENPFPRKDRPLKLENLHVVAFIQNDAAATKDVLQAAQAEVPPEEGGQ